jgi:preprotein translocase subunit YajC
MSGGGEFRRGDRVQSPAGFIGTVTRVADGVVYVEYRGEKRPRDARRL